VSSSLLLVLYSGACFVGLPSLLPILVSQHAAAIAFWYIFLCCLPFAREKRCSIQWLADNHCTNNFGKSSLSTDPAYLAASQCISSRVLPTTSNSSSQRRFWRSRQYQQQRSQTQAQATMGSIYRTQKGNRSQSGRSCSVCPNNSNNSRY
jgi:hypothetical protein